MCLLYSWGHFILLPFCLIVSLCSKFMSFGGCIVLASAIVSFLSVFHCIRMFVLCKCKNWSVSSFNLSPFFGWLAFETHFWGRLLLIYGWPSCVSSYLFLCIQSSVLLSCSFFHCGPLFHTQLQFHGSMCLPSYLCTATFHPVGIEDYFCQYLYPYLIGVVYLSVQSGYSHLLHSIGGLLNVSKSVKQQCSCSW